MAREQSLTRWDEIFASAEGDLSEPSPFLIKELDRLKLKGWALDLGCGAGRHCIHLARSGFDTWGFDVSRKALEKAALNLRTAGTSARLTQGDMGNLPYGDGLFDLVVSINVTHHADSEGVRRNASEICRVLRPGGYLIATLSTTRDYKFGQGVKVEEKTFLHTSGVEAGILHHFMDEADIRDCFRPFGIEYLAEEQGSFFFYESKKNENYHWFLTASKNR
ncbi:MAG: class I SAM-dependent methyltransferase [Dehalococcoidia bacterium]